MTQTFSPDDPTHQILLSLLRGFYWFDEGLLNFLKSKGWPAITRPQSMVMANIAMGVKHPSDIARKLGISRQAIHATLKSMIALDMVQLVSDPTNKRVKIVDLTPTGERMREDAQHAMTVIVEELTNRIGKSNLQKAAVALDLDWGTPMSFPMDKR